MEAQFFTDLSNDDYHADKSIISKSMLKTFASCPAKFKHKYIDGNDETKSKSLRMGSAVHVLALEPELWKRDFHVFPATYFDGTGKKKKFVHRLDMTNVQDEYMAAGYEVGKNDDGVLEAKAGANAKTILTVSEYAEVEAMADSLAKHTEACNLLKQDGHVECSIFFDYEVENPMTGEVETVRCKTRPDHLANIGVGNDLKTARSADPKIFFTDACNMYYDVSAAMTSIGYEALKGQPLQDYAFVVVESSKPHIVEIYDSTGAIDDIMGMSYIEYGKARFKKLMESYVMCRSSDTWGGYQNGVGSMSIPKWAANEFIEKGI